MGCAPPAAPADPLQNVTDPPHTAVKILDASWSCGGHGHSLPTGEPNQRLTAVAIPVMANKRRIW